MRKKFLHGTALWTFLFAATLATGCSDNDNDYKDVDGQSPSLEVTSNLLHVNPGDTVKLAASITDADGISAIRLRNSDLYLDKTIDLLEIYGEPQTAYELEYSLFLSESLPRMTEYPIAITVTDVGGRTVDYTIVVLTDNDSTKPSINFVASGKVTALLKDGTIPFHFIVEDDQAIDYVEASISSLGISEKVDAEGKTKLDGVVRLSVTQSGTYNVSLKVVDKFGNETTTTSSYAVTVATSMPDFEKMYLTDVTDVDELTSDFFGVPMLVDRVGAYQYEARYYSAARGTKVRFVPQKTDFYPICFGIDPNGTGKLTNDADISEPIVLQEKGYYKITFNTSTGVYSAETYTPSDEALPYGKMVDPNPNDIVEANKYEYAMALTGSGLPTIDNNDTWSPNWNNSIRLSQDKENKYLLYTELELTKGRKLSFCITPYHPWGWWLSPAWHFENKSGENEYLIDNNSMEMSQTTILRSGKYMFKFDYHLLRARLYPID